ncbi:MAG: mechanosensitive ion channel family protein [Chloroflexota bacterium]
MLEQSPWRESLPFIEATVVPIVLIVFVAWLTVRLGQRLVSRLVEELLDREVSEGTARELSQVEVQKRKDTIKLLAANVLRAFVFLIAGVMILDKLDVNIGPAVAGLGVVGIAVGFGAQSLVRDYFTGVLILIENQFSRGDTVSVAGVSGIVEDFSLRRTTLRDEDGVVHSVPNGEIKVASNRTRVWVGITLDLAFPFGADIDATSRLIDDVVAEMAAEDAWHGVLLEPPRVLGIGRIGSTVTIQVRGRVVAAKEDEAIRELRRRVYGALREAGVTPQGA